MIEVRMCSAAAATVLTLGGLSSCGGTRGGSVAVRIGKQVISKTTVNHWTDVVESGGAFTGFRGEPHSGTPKQRALALLISSTWLIGEAVRQGVPVSREAVDEVVAERGETRHELRKRLEAIGQTLAGLEFELRAELAFEAIGEELSRRAGEMTRTEVAGFYQKNTRLFSTPKVHLVDIVEGLPSAQVASALVRRVGTGSRFAKLAYHKELAETSGVLAGPASKKRVDYAIYTAKRGVVSRPMSLNGAWAVFVVRKTIAPRAKPLASVYDEVAARLKEHHMRSLKKVLEREYRLEWTRKTHCHAGYVAPGCTQYLGGLGRYEDPFTRA